MQTILARRAVRYAFRDQLQHLREASQVGIPKHLFDFLKMVDFEWRADCLRKRCVPFNRVDKSSCDLFLARFFIYKSLSLVGVVLTSFSTKLFPPNCPSNSFLLPWCQLPFFCLPRHSILVSTSLFATFSYFILHFLLNFPSNSPACLFFVSGTSGG